MVDGDTIKVILNGTATNIRLHGIDAPETGQDFGRAAANAMKQLTTGRTVTIQVLDQDRYGRPVAMMYADGANLNEAMLEWGYAWVYTKYCTQKFCRDWIMLQDKVKAKRAGLWSGRAPTPPWEWRHGGAVASSAPAPAMYGLASSVKNPTTKAASQEIAAGGPYSGNVQSHKFHRPGCKHYNCKNCTAKFATREQAKAAGYSPCGICKP